MRGHAYVSVECRRGRIEGEMCVSGRIKGTARIGGGGKCARGMMLYVYVCGICVNYVLMCLCAYVRDRVVLRPPFSIRYR